MQTTSTASGIYRLLNINTNKYYVGSAVNFRNRLKDHLSRLRRNAHHSPRLQNSYNRHGESAFVFEIVEIVEDKSKLIEIEQKYIDDGIAFGVIYNASPTAASILGKKDSEATKKRKSEAQQRVPLEVRQARSLVARKLERTQEWKDNISKAHKGKKLSDEHKKKLSEAHKNKPDSVKLKVAEAIRMSDIARGGKRHSDESKRKISESLRLRIAEKNRLQIKE